MSSLDQPHKGEMLNEPYAGVVPPERVVIDSFRGERTRFWYISDSQDLIEVKSHKTKGQLADGENFVPRIYRDEDGNETYLI